jgi:hypothetical protein
MGRCVVGRAFSSLHQGTWGHNCEQGVVIVVPSYTIGGASVSASPCKIDLPHTRRPRAELKLCCIYFCSKLVRVFIREAQASRTAGAVMIHLGVTGPEMTREVPNSVAVETSRIGTECNAERISGAVEDRSPEDVGGKCGVRGS